MSFDVFGLHAVLLSNLRNAGFTAPTPVQEQAMPPALEGLDVMACAQTGTGKTAAFVLPSLHRLLANRPRNNGNGPRLLVLTPTRELAQQVAENVKLFAPADRLRVGVVVGGVAYPPQNRLLSQKLDVLVATPGRLIDHMQEGRVDLSRVDVLVLDEADRMLDMGFQKPVERIVEQTPADRQTLLFSATFSDGVRKIGRHMQKTPVMIELAPVLQRHDNITQSVIRVDDRSHKQKILETLLRDGKVWQAIVFVGTKRYADTLTEKLNDREIPCAALHGDMRQSARKRTLDAMHRGSLRVLVATDVAARGLDVKDLTHVFNFDLPQVAEDYVHRIGRTGRAGATGEAVSLVSPQDAGMLREIEKMLGMHIERRTIEGMESRQSNAAFERQGESSKPRGRGGKPSSSRFGGSKPQGKFNRFEKSDRSATERSPSNRGGNQFVKPERFDRSEQSAERPRRDNSLDSGWGGKSSSSREGRPSQGKSQGNWAGGKSSSYSDRSDKPRSDKPYGKPASRFASDKPRSEGKSWGDKPRSATGRSEGKSWGDKPRSSAGRSEGKSWGDKPRSSAGRSEGKSWGDKPRSATGRSEGKSWGDKPKSFGGGKPSAAGRSGARTASAGAAGWSGKTSTVRRRSASA